MIKVKIKPTQEIVDFGTTIAVNNVMMQITEGLVHMNPALFEIIYEKEILIQGEDGPIYKGEDYFVIYTDNFVKNNLKNGPLYQVHCIKASKVEKCFDPTNRYIVRFREEQNAKAWLEKHRLLCLSYFTEKVEQNGFYVKMKEERPEVYWLKVYSLANMLKKTQRLGISLNFLFAENRYVKHLL